jgi:hypothetical protein
MRLIDAISIIGTLLTAIGTAVTLWQASKVRRYRQQIAFDLRKIHLSEVRELLRGAQDEGRKLLSHVQQLNRGKSILTITENIQAYIDHSLNLLHLSGPDSDLREKILSAQTHLRGFQNSSNENEKRQCVSDMHAVIQDTISLGQERVTVMEMGGGHAR